MEDGVSRLTAEQIAELTRLATSRRSPQDQAARAHMVLACVETPVGEVAQAVGVTPRTVTKWRRRYEELGVAGLRDAPRSGRPRSDDVADRILRCVLDEPEGRWTTRSIAAAVGQSQSTVSRIRRELFRQNDSLIVDLPVNAVLAFVYVESGRSVLGFHDGSSPGRVRHAASGAREACDAIEVLLSAARLCPERRWAGGSVGSDELLRYATAQFPEQRRVTFVVDFELDDSTRAWVRRVPNVTVVTVGSDAWLGLLGPITDAVDPRQLPEITGVAAMMREWFRAGVGKFEWSRGGRTSDSSRRLEAVATDARRGSSSEVVVAGICEAIAEGSMHAGRVINTRSLTTRTHLSAGALTDVLRHLAEDGLVNQDQAGRFYVPAPAERDVLESYTARGLLGTAIVRRLAARGGGLPDSVAEVYRKIGQSATRDEPVATGSLDLDLQDELARAADMPRIEAMFTRLTLQIRLFAAALGVSYLHPVDGLMADDARVVEAIAASDQDAAVAAWRAKIDNCIRYMVPHLSDRRRR